MLAVLRQTWPLMLGMLLIMIGNGLQGTLLGVRGSIEHISPETMGYVIAAYFAGFLGGSKAAPVLIRGVGHVRVFAALGSMISAAYLLFAAWVEPAFWIFLRFVVGFCMAAIYVVTESWLNDISTNKTRGTALGLYMMVQMAGVISGQQLLNIADPAGYDLFILISVLVSISFAPILLLTKKAPLFETAKPLSFRELYRASPLGVVGVFLMGGVFASTFGMISVYGTETKLSVAQIATYISVMYLGGLFFQYPIGWLSDSLDRRQLIVTSAGIGAVAAIIVPIFGNAYWLLLFTAFFIGGMTNPLYGLLVAYTNDYLEVEQMPSASGSMIFLNGMGAMGSPILVGYLMQMVGPHGYFIFLSSILFAICSYGLYRMTVREAIELEEQSPYIPLTSRTTQVLGQVAAEYVADGLDEEAHDEAVAKALESEHDETGEPSPPESTEDISTIDTTDR